MSIQTFNRGGSAKTKELLDLFAPIGETENFATGIGIDRIIRKETSLGVIRNFLQPDTHIGLTLCPFLEVQTDDVVFQYLPIDTDGLAPARADDSEAELAQKDEAFAGEGRASVIDWSIKDRYAASDVKNYRDALRVLQALVGQDASLPLFVTSALEDWAGKLAKDAALRRRKLDNRIEWLIMTSLGSGVVAYNDGKIKFSVDFGRPAAQGNGQASNPSDSPNGLALGTLLSPFVTAGVVNWSSTTHDPIGFIEAVVEYMYLAYGIRITRCLCSKQVVRRIVNSDKFAQRAGLGFATHADGTAAAPDLHYLLDGWGPDAARQVVENATGVNFIVYDSVYRTRPWGSNTITNTRFFPANEMVFLPSDDSVGEYDDTLVGFAKFLTSPHPEGNFEPGFYEWEQYRTDPWGYDVGSGIKGFPIFPHMEYTYAVNVTL